MEPRFIFLQLSSIRASPSTIISLFSSLSPATVKPAILNCAEWILFVTTCHKMLSRHWSQTFFPSRIDYSNSLLTGCPKELIHKLKKVQNNAARLICQIPKTDHISPVLHTLHWHPGEQKIELKLLLLPSYLYTTMIRHICLTSWSSTFFHDSFALSLTPVFFAFLHSVWNPLDDANSNIRHLFYETIFGSHSLIPTLHLPSNLI